MDNIKVKPDNGPRGVRVATDEVVQGGDNVHFPIYKQAFGIAGAEPTHVSAVNPLPVSFSSEQTAYGELTVAQNLPEIQVSARYNTMRDMREITIGSGSTSVTAGEYCASTGTDADGIGAIFSKRQVISHAGIGSLARFTARFPDAGGVGSRLFAGLTTAIDGAGFAYVDGVFGISYLHGGEVLIEHLDITVAATGGETATVTINGAANAIPITAGTAEHNAYEISKYINDNIANYAAENIGAKVIARTLFGAPAFGDWLFSSDGDAVAGWTEVVAGVVPDRDNVARANWNVDTKSDLVPANVNNYAVRFNGAIEFYIQDSVTARYVLVHIVRHPNTGIDQLFSIPAFRMGWTAVNSGATQDVAVYGSSGSAFNEGLEVSTEVGKSEIGSIVSLGADLTNVLSIRCRTVYGSKVNLGRIIPLIVSGSTGSNFGAVIEVRLNPTFATSPDFFQKDDVESIASVSTDAIVVSGGELISTIEIGATAAETLGKESLDIQLLPLDVLCVAMRVPTGAASNVEASIGWHEDL